MFNDGSPKSKKSPPGAKTTSSSWSFDIDNYLNRFVPRPRLYLLPGPISRLLGHRTTPQPPIPEPLVWLWAFVGTFLGISLVTAIFHAPAIRSHFPTNAPLIIVGSLGATAVLEYNACTSPLSQPRNVILGQVLSSVVGISITKAFMLLPPDRFQDLRWLAGALAVSSSTVVMGITKTLHPPAGATALLAATSNEIMELGWFLIPMTALGSVLMVLVACITNNVQRQFPLHWWTELDLNTPFNEEDAEHGTMESDDDRTVHGCGSDAGKKEEGKWVHVERVERREGIVVDAMGIIVPGWIVLSKEERSFLKALRARVVAESKSLPV